MRIKRIAALAIAAPVALAGLGWLLQRAGLKYDVRRYPPPGVLLLRRGRSLHVLQQGTGRPAVIFEAGLAASSLSWARVQPLLAAHTSTSSYDRAGLGWSSPLSSRPSLTQMLDDLHSVLAWTAADAPAVLVGHSFGALLALALAQRHPERVAGLVLVEPASLTQWADCSAENRRRLQLGAQLSRRGAWLAEFGVVRAALMLLLGGGSRVSKAVGRAAAGPGAATLARLAAEVSKLPPEVWPAVAAHWSRAQSFRAMAHTLEALPACAAAIAQLTLPPALPVVILSSATAAPDELRERAGWLAPLAQAQHILIPETGHWLHLEQPEAVAAAVRWCVEESQGPAAKQT